MLTATDATATPHVLRSQEGSKQAGRTALWGRRNRTKLVIDNHRRKTENQTESRYSVSPLKRLRMGDSAHSLPLPTEAGPMEAMSVVIDNHALQADALCAPMSMF